MKTYHFTLLNMENNLVVNETAEASSYLEALDQVRADYPVGGFTVLSWTTAA